jgi:NADH:ubiquinone oxidoreductase subunit 4 (subunit M)
VLASLFLIVALATLAIPGSSNFAGEFLILLGVFKAKLAIAIIAFTGVVMASVYALRLFIRAMHNRVGSSVDSREISIRDGAVLVPLIAVILFLALYPQFALHRSEGSVKSTVAAAHVYATVNPASVHVFATNSSPIRTGTISGEARQESGEPEAQQASESGSEDGASSSERGAPAGTR